MSCNTSSVKKACCIPTPDRHPDAVHGSQSDAAGVLHPLVADQMVDLPGGTFLMGTDYAEAFPDDGEGPVREISLSPFRIDRFPVTNKLFRSFVSETGYSTDAEQFDWSFVFWSHLPASRIRELVVDTVANAPWWCKVRGAKWDSPEGPGSHIENRSHHPVVHVSWGDAQAYCKWSGQRLPTEAEWEYAARGGLVQKLYPWGDKLRPNGEHRCNIWQGDFPNRDTAEDGYSGTCPVDAFPPNGYGLYSLSGNTWEWCADWFDTKFHQEGPRLNPTGPTHGSARVMKGGSFLCHKSYCNRYRVAARTSSTPDSSTSHLGFRCAL